MTAAIYARKSTDQTGVAEDQKSVARQVDHAKAYAAKKGWTVDDRYVYIDDGVSGAEFDKRPGYNRLLKALKPRPPFQALVMSEESRLGREAIDTSHALKQILTAGVRVFFYLDDREAKLGTMADNTMSFLRAEFAAEEQRKSRQRTTDAMVRKAERGEVCGGRVFGYDNVAVLKHGKRSHVERKINERHAAVVRQIFELAAAGHSQRAIAKQLNAEGAPSPRRQRSWSPSSVREALLRDLYRGELVYNKTRKRDEWRQKKQIARPEREWKRRPMPELRIVADQVWDAVQARMRATREHYLKTTNGQSHGRPALGNPSRYLLTTLAACGSCGGGLEVSSRSNGKTGRKFFYVCSHHRERGTCSAGDFIPMAEADALIIDVVHDQLEPKLLEEAIAFIIERLQADTRADRLEGIEEELRGLDRQAAKLADIIMETDGDVDTLVKRLQDVERRRKALRVDRDAIVAQGRQGSRNTARLREDLLELAGSWRSLLAENVSLAREVISKVNDGRITFRPQGMKVWSVTGTTTLGGLFGSVLTDMNLSGFLEPGKDGVEEWVFENGTMKCAEAMASPMGFEPMFWP